MKKNPSGICLLTKKILLLLLLLNTFILIEKWRLRAIKALKCPRHATHKLTNEKLK